MKLAIVVQRYGADINGGAELHARYIAEHLSAHADVQVLTTCARDYITWRDAYPEGPDRVNGVAVLRFRVSREREPLEFGRLSTLVFTKRHSVADELQWLDAEGPTSTALVEHLRTHHRDFDYVLLFSIRYYQAYHGARAAADRAVLVPTAERDPAVALSIFQPVFRGVRGIMYNSFEERALIQELAANAHVPGVVVGVGSDIPTDVAPSRARQAFNLRNPYVVYVGRIDENKGCGELFEFFLRHAESAMRSIDLVLIGNPVIPVPQHSRIRHLGFVSDQEKFDVMAGAEALVMPSYFESLSMVALEAWALGRPVIANAHCDVLLGQSLRSNAGLFYHDAEEFSGILTTLAERPSLSATLGERGRDYFRRHYAWPVIERKYLDMFERLRSEPASPMEPLPGWWTRRARTIAPAADILAAAPSGPAIRAVERGAAS